MGQLHFTSSVCWLLAILQSSDIRLLLLPIHLFCSFNYAHFTQLCITESSGNSPLLRLRQRVEFAPIAVLVKQQLLPVLAVDVRCQAALVLGAVFAERALELWILAALEAYVPRQRRLVVVDVAAVVTWKESLGRDQLLLRHLCVWLCLGRGC